VAGNLIRFLPWREPLEAFAPFADEPWALLLLSGAGGRWSYIARRPAAAETVGPEDDDRDFTRVRRLLGARTVPDPAGPPFQGGVVGLAAYEFAHRLDAATPLPAFGRTPPCGESKAQGHSPRPRRDPEGLEGAWPDLILARYEAVLAFDHEAQSVFAVGGAQAWLDAPARAAGVGAGARLVEETSGDGYEAAVREVKAAIAAGEIFQANIARAWSGRLSSGETPFAVFARLVSASPAPYSAYWRLPGRAIVSHSPERFLGLRAGRVETRPIKGTAPRAADPGEDTAFAAALVASAKDRAENLMIVDLMRNDIARVCEPGSVEVIALCALESFAAVHHLVSTVTGRLRAGADAADLLAAAFPPGSITGAPKVQAMKVIARHEPRPRGPWCGSLFWTGFGGDLDSSVLIRTAAFTETADGWRFRFQAGAGIVADSDPAAERAETRMKAAGLLRALGA
jgi:para-aminobenzoate synthetase component 1